MIDELSLLKSTTLLEVPGSRQSMPSASLKVLDSGQYNMLERSWRILLVYQKAGCNDTLVIIFIKTSKMESIKTRLMLIPLQLSPQLSSNFPMAWCLPRSWMRVFAWSNRLFSRPIIWYSTRSSCTGWKFHLPHKKTQTASITRPQSFSTYKSWGWKNGPFLCVSSACIKIGRASCRERV